MKILSLYGCCGWASETWFLHSAGASFWDNNNHICTISEERLSRKKYDGEYPQLSIDYVLKAGKVNNNDIDLVVYVGSIFSADTYETHVIPVLKREFKNAEIVLLDHHVAHASAAFYSSNFERANILTFDGSGSLWNGFTEEIEKKINGVFNNYSERETGFFGIADVEKGVNIINHFLNLHGAETAIWEVGSFYNYNSRLIYSIVEPEAYAKQSVGQPNHIEKLLWESAPGKIMGLSAYGNEENIKKFNKKEIKLVRRHISGFPILVWDRSIDFENAKAEILPHMRIYDYALWVQRHFQENVVAYLKAVKDTGFRLEDNLCLAGGCALNVLTNTAIKESGLFKSVFVHPASNDTGLCYGGGAWAVKEYLNKKPVNKKFLACTGIDYKATYKDTIERYQNKNQIDVNDITLNQLAEKISKGDVVGFFNVDSSSEFGPRALGFRSILADPRRKDIKDHLNSNVKYREWWRPYAPVVIAERKEKYFDAPDSEYMMFSGKVLVDNLPGITHEDGTARVQTVYRKNNEQLYELLEEFEKITGVPVLLNTSFNLNDEPIVETPEHAMKTFLRSNLDGLYMGGKYITKAIAI